MAAITGPVVTAPIDSLASAPGFSPAARAGAEVSTFPAGFPSKLKEKMAWTGSDFPEPSQYALVLVEDEVVEIKAAVKSYKGKPPHDFLRMDTTDTTQPWARMEIWLSPGTFLSPPWGQSSRK